MSTKRRKTKHRATRTGAGKNRDRAIRADAYRKYVEASQVTDGDWQRLDRALGALTLDDFEVLMADLKDSEKREISKCLVIKVDPQYVRGGYAKLVKNCLKGVSGSRKKRVVEVLMMPLFALAESELGDSFENPTEEQVCDLANTLIEKFGITTTTVFYAFLSAIPMSATPHARKCLLENELLRNVVAPPTSVDNKMSSEILEKPKTGKPADHIRQVDIGYLSVNATQEEQDSENSSQTPAALEDALFSELDKLLINATVSSFANEIGAIGRQEMKIAIEQILSLNSKNKSSYFHIGFFNALDHNSELPQFDEMENERWDWYWFGYLTGLVRSDAKKELQLVCKNYSERVLSVLAAPRTGRSLVSKVLLENLKANPRFVIELLRKRAEVADEMAYFDNENQTFRAILDRIRKALIDGESAIAAELSEAVIKWCKKVETMTLTPLWIEAHRYRAASSRSAGDFDTAKDYLDKANSLLKPLRFTSPKSRALLLLEMGLVKAKVDHLTTVYMPGETDVADELKSKLEAGEVDFYQALEQDPSQFQAAYCMGVLEALRENWTKAAGYFANAVEKMRHDDVFMSSALDIYREAEFMAIAARICGAISALIDEDVRKLIELLKQRNYQPIDRIVTTVAEVIFVRSTDSASDFALAALEVVKDPACLLEVINGVLASPRDEYREKLARAALELSRDKRLKFKDKISLATGALNCAAVLSHSDELIEELIDQCEDLVNDSGSDEVAEIWLKTLRDEDGWANRILGPIERQIASAMMLLRLRQPEVAIEGLRTLAYQLASSRDGKFGILDIIDCLRDLGASEEVVEEIKCLVGDQDESVANEKIAALAVEPIRLIFVGGNEEQRRQQKSIEHDLISSFGDRVKVSWYHPNWASNWLPVAEKVLTGMEHADCLVLMPLVRTNLGRRLRRGVGEMRKPWVSCTGRGRNSIFRSLERAVDVVVEQRTRENSSS